MDPSGVCNLFEEAVQISQSDITFSLNPGEGSLKLSWHSIKGWKWKEIEGGLIQFTFTNREDAMNVLARRSWFVCGALIIIMPWPSWLTPAELSSYIYVCGENILPIPSK
ncbi:hypothetical protein F8388_003550 [Cannabis sativa]|uniref:DUF4283 domain-containing protein n=1 Tax=Cannabis sativa TaxID=3483 RepID=A0A7J6EM63_CANSA|nr:hypothetical protein F8388_003550 [Cannabis sativa]